MLESLLQVPEEGTASELTLYLQELGDLVLFLGQLMEVVARVQSHIVRVRSRSPERGGCRRPAGAY